jgi:hypothetical protein
MSLDECLGIQPTTSCGILAAEILWHMSCAGIGSMPRDGGWSCGSRRSGRTGTWSQGSGISSLTSFLPTPDTRVLFGRGAPPGTFRGEAHSNRASAFFGAVISRGDASFLRAVVADFGKLAEAVPCDVAGGHATARGRAGIPGFPPEVSILACETPWTNPVSTPQNKTLHP